MLEKALHWMLETGLLGVVLTLFLSCIILIVGSLFMLFSH